MIRHKYLFYIPLFLICLCVMFLIFNNQIMICINAAVSEESSYTWENIGSRSIFQTSESTDGEMAAVRWNKNRLYVQTLDYALDKGIGWSIELPEDDYNNCQIVDVYPVRADKIILAVYTIRAEKLELWRLERGVDAELLLSESCDGSSSRERMQNCRLTEFYYENGVLCFGIMKPQEVRSYSFWAESGRVEAMGVTNVDTSDILSCLVLTYGHLVYGGKGFLNIDGVNKNSFSEDMVVTHIRRGMSGWYFVDATDFMVCLATSDSDPVLRLVSLEPCINNHTLDDIVIYGEGIAIVLVDSSRLFYMGVDYTEQLDGILYPTFQESALVRRRCPGGNTLALYCGTEPRLYAHGCLSWNGTASHRAAGSDYMSILCDKTGG